MFGSEGVSTIVLTLFVILGVFLLIRKIVLWYFKFDVMAEYQREILEQLKIMNGLATPGQKPSATERATVKVLSAIANFKRNFIKKER
ncbi:MAG TPA: hypothetical protein DDW17_01990 [Deltaproteobacteria bacterium]|nr:hypothetical protein [Deltaproteobacteria bacterium]